MQRVSRAAVRVAGDVTGEIGRGLVVLLAVGRDDAPADVDSLADKIAHLRVFDDPAGQMNLSVVDVGRPSFIAAARPEVAQGLYRQFVARVAAIGLPVAEGGPVTLLLDSKGAF